MPKPKKLASWSDFELRVKHALEAIGYTVTRDHLMAGTQVDLFGELHGELFVHRQAIECKSSHYEVGVEEVRQLSALVETISTKNRPVTGLLVAAKGFTRTAKEFANHSGIKLLSLTELAALSFDPEPIIDHTIQWFEQDELGRSYVQLSCQVKEGTGGTIYKPVEKFLDDFFATTKRPGIAVLGNFGTGKTSLCKHYAYLLACRWKKEDRRFLPIYINLRDCQSLIRIEDEIYNALVANYAIQSSPGGLKQWFLSGSTLLFLDGFDEMASKLDRVTINENLTALTRFCECRQTKIVLSCRTHFFKTQIEESALKGLLRLYMCDWGAAELEAYVQKSLPGEADSSLKIIRNTYNLEELAKTPIFLNMITITIEELRGSVNQAKLYQLYTDRWIQNQDYRSKVSPHQKRQFMEEAAFEMFSSQRPRIAYDQLPIRIGHTFDLRDYESISDFDRDIRTCSFLVRDDEGFYYFSHKSFMEFFVGARLAQQVKEGKLEDFESVELSLETASFFANYFESDWMHLIRLLIGGKSNLCRANSALSLGRIGFNKKIRDALVLALETDNSIKVKMRVIDSLAALHDPISIRAIADFAMRRGELGSYCLRALAPFCDEEVVVEIYSSILRDSSDIDQLCATLNCIAAQRLVSFRSHLASFINRENAPRSDEIALAFLTALEGVADIYLSLHCEEFVTKHALQSIHRNYALQVQEELSKRARSEMEYTARRNKQDGMSRSKNSAELRRNYRYLLNGDYLSGLLSSIYPETTKMKAKRKKR